MSTVRQDVSTPLAPRPADSFGFQDIVYEKRDWVARVTINRPGVYNAYPLPERTFSFSLGRDF